MLNLRSLYTLLFLVGWFFFPFNDFEGIEALGEYKSEAGSFFFLAGFVLLCLEAVYKKKIGLPYQSTTFKILILFILWCCITTFLNHATVAENFFKHTSGYYRFVRQLISLLIASFIFLILYWNVLIRLTLAEILTKIRTVLLASLIFVFVYGFLETLVQQFYLYQARYVLALFDYFPFLDIYYSHDGRISSVAYEAPSLGNYLITVSGWMFSYIITSKSKWRFVPTLMVLFLAFFSGSRTAYINIFLQLLILLSVLIALPAYRPVFKRIFLTILVFIPIVIIYKGPEISETVEKRIKTLDFKNNLKKNVSNKSRFGMQLASIEVFKENPIIGVGLGQETYHKRHHYPLWAKRDNYEFRLMYENKSFKSFPTAYNLYTRLLAETGLIGIGLFLSLIFVCIRGAYHIWKTGIEHEKTLGFIMLVSFTGLSVNWLQTDFFRQHGFWLCAVILMIIYHRRKEISLMPAK